MIFTNKRIRLVIIWLILRYNLEIILQLYNGTYTTKLTALDWAPFHLRSWLFLEIELR